MVAAMHSIIRIVLAGAVIAALSVSALAQQTGASVLARAVAATQAARAAYAFDFELQSEERNWRARYDPGASPRLRMVQPRLDQLDTDDRRAFERFAEQMEGVSWCASENLGRVRDVRLVREDATTAVYAFQPTRESIRGEQARRFADRLRGELTLDKAANDITRVRLYIPRAFSPMPLVNVAHFNVVSSCAVAPNGRRYAAETVSDVRGSAFGQDINERSVQRARNLSAS